MAYHITYLHKKGPQFEWDQKCKENFEKLKQLFNIAPVLRIANPNKEFEVCTGASKEDVGVFLSQEGKVVAYESRSLKENEQRYSAYDLELTAKVHVLWVWRHYLLGKNFVLKRYHSSLTIYFNQDD